MDILTPEQVAEAYAALDKRERLHITRMLLRPQAEARSIARAERLGVPRHVGVPTPKE